MNGWSRNNERSPHPPPSDDDGLAVVLTSAGLHLRDVENAIRELQRDSRSTEAALADLEKLVGDLAEDIGAEKPACTPADDALSGRVAARAAATIRDWQSVRASAARNLASRGVDLSAVSVDALLERDEVARIDRRLVGGFTVQAQLDRYDVVAIVAAGLAAALVDFVIVRIPHDVIYLNQFAQAGSPFTKWLHSLDVPADNRLARHSAVSFDRSGGRDHRFWTPGHDPLIGLVVGTIDVMRGGMTEIAQGGRLMFTPALADAVPNPLRALVRVILHLLSDVPTRMGLPPPGWSALAAFNAGSFGEKERTISDLARFMYLKGYDSRHFLTMSTSVAAVEVILRAYFWIRRRLDEEYEKDTAHQAAIVGATRSGDHPRFRAMAVGAYGIAAAANAGKLALYQGNPLALNYATWLAFLTSLFRWTRQHLTSPTDVLVGTARANRIALENGWAAMDPSDPSFPTLELSVAGLDT